MKKIDVMIVGAQKSATTSLKENLKKHPQINSHSCKEFTYFIENTNNNFEEYFNHYNNELKNYNIDTSKWK